VSLMINEKVKQDIIKAIQARKTITFDYKAPEDTQSTKRIGEPHALYINNTSAIELIDLFQTAGEASDMLSIPNWKRFPLEHISNVLVHYNKGFIVRNTYKSSSDKYKHSIAKI
jgi:hypothetical protein